MADEPVDFRDLLSKPLGDFPDRPNLPGAKSFYGKLLSLGAGVSAQKGTPHFRFTVRLTDGGQDVKSTDLEKIAAAGFSLADYEVYSDFWLTPNSMPMLRSFLVSLGFPENATFKEVLKLNDFGEPTSDSQEAIRGLDVIVRTQNADENGRVYAKLDRIAGKKSS
jgi:hypothetical protein